MKNKKNSKKPVLFLGLIHQKSRLCRRWGTDRKGRGADQNAAEKRKQRRKKAEEKRKHKR